MTIQLVAFDVPADLQADIARGLLVQHGGVVRDQAGKIVTFLDEVTETAQDGSAARALLKSAQVHPLATTTVAVMAVGAVALAIRRRHTDLHDALHTYLTALQDQDLDTATIDRLLAEIDHATRGNRHSVRPWGWGAAKVRSLLASVQDYTCRLANAHHFPTTEVALPLADSQDCSILDLRPYLQAQRTILTLPA